MGNNQSEEYDLERIKEVLAVLKAVEQRKIQASGYNRMVSTIAVRLGTEREGHRMMSHVYHEPGLEIISTQSFDCDDDPVGNVYYVLTPGHRVVYGCSSGRGGRNKGIEIYRPGEWEQRFKELYEPLKPKEVPLEKRIEVPSMTERELRDLRDRFGLNNGGVLC